ncbi:hypothetical protein Tco_0600186 [Tanacetum coccineum]|uniref:Uncharacterized protein n=1 Tax=Tanacetum coccineum TaxID=301880 RepID=A0ABQ4WB73_9ASTR
MIEILTTMRENVEIEFERNLLLEKLKEYEEKVRELQIVTARKFEVLLEKLKECEAKQRENSDKLSELEAGDRERKDKISELKARQRKIDDKLSESEARRRKIVDKLSELKARKRKIVDKLNERDAIGRKISDKINAQKSSNRGLRRTTNKAEAKARGEVISSTVPKDNPLDPNLDSWLKALAAKTNGNDVTGMQSINSIYDLRELNRVFESQTIFADLRAQIVSPWGAPMMLTVRGTPNPYYAPFYSTYMNNGCGLMGMAANGYDETGCALSAKLSKLSIGNFDRNICLLQLAEIKLFISDVVATEVGFAFRLNNRTLSNQH